MVTRGLSSEWFHERCSGLGWLEKAWKICTCPSIYTVIEERERLYRKRARDWQRRQGTKRERRKREKFIETVRMLPASPVFLRSIPGVLWTILRNGCGVIPWMKSRGTMERYWFPAQQPPKEGTRGVLALKRDRKVVEEIWRLKRLGITVEDVAGMVRRQGARCAICHRLTRLVVDHDHRTGIVRGLLCTGCNTAIGVLQDSPTILARAIRYIQQPRLL